MRLVLPLMLLLIACGTGSGARTGESDGGPLGYLADGGNVCGAWSKLVLTDTPDPSRDSPDASCPLGPHADGDVIHTKTVVLHAPKGSMPSIDWTWTEDGVTAQWYPVPQGSTSIDWTDGGSNDATSCGTLVVRVDYDDGEYVNRGLTFTQSGIQGIGSYGNNNMECDELHFSTTVASQP